MQKRRDGRTEAKEDRREAMEEGVREWNARKQGMELLAGVPE